MIKDESPSNWYKEVDKLEKADSLRSHAHIPMNDSVKSYYDKLFINDKKIAEKKILTHIKQIKAELESFERKTSD
jgi:hypothetical protein